MISEKACIITLDYLNMLNKRSEFTSKCQHVNKQLLNRVKDDINDWLWCVFVFTVCFLYYLWNNCNLCISEKAFIRRTLDDLNMLKKRSEFTSKCQHINKWLLNRVKVYQVCI